MPHRKDVQFGLVYLYIFECLLNSRSQPAKTGREALICSLNGWVYFATRAVSSLPIRAHRNVSDRHTVWIRMHLASFLWHHKTQVSSLEDLAQRCISNKCCCNLSRPTFVWSNCFLTEVHPGRHRYRSSFCRLHQVWASQNREFSQEKQPWWCSASGLTFLYVSYTIIRCYRNG